MKLCFDFETSTFNKGNAFDSRNKAISYSLKKDAALPTHHRFDDIDFSSVLRAAFNDATLLVGQNLKFDLHWARKLGCTVAEGCRIWDTQLAEFILSGQTNSYASLNSLAEMYSLPVKLDEVAGYWEKGIDTEDIPKYILEEYNNYDVSLTYAVYEQQLKDKRLTPQLYKLILVCGADLLVLEEMEWNGLKYDSEASLEEASVLKEELTTVDEKLKTYAGNINFNSGDQLSAFLYGGSYDVDVATPETRVYKSGPNKGQEYVMNRWSVHTETLPGYFKPLPRSELKKSTPERPFYATGDDVLKQLKARTKVQKEIITLLQRRAYLEKLVSTYLEALPKLIEERHWGGYLHGQYNQVVARTGRLSSSSPNLQNTPKEVDAYIVSRYD